jgi:hypothetical protein
MKITTTIGRTDRAKLVTRASLPLLILLSLACASTATREVDKRSTGAAVGAVVGAGIGAVAGRDLKAAAAGAAVGGAVGFGVGWLAEHYEVRRVRDEASIEEEYGAPQDKGPPQIHAYRTWIDPEAIRKGTEAGWISSFDIQVPPDTTVRVVEERVFVDPDGNTISRRTYDYSQDITGSGGYEFELTIPVPESAPEGKYGYQTRLTVDHQEVSRLQGSFQIAWSEVPRVMTVAQVN